MTDSGKCAFVLGIELVDGPDGSVTMCQRRYVDDILKRFGMDECKAVVSPVDISTRLISSDAATKVNAPFREAVGALMHLMTATRPDIAYAVGYVFAFHGESSRGTLGGSQAYLFATCKAPRRTGSASSRANKDRLSWILGTQAAEISPNRKSNFRLHVHADECACELGQHENSQASLLYE
ncbi:hypothetical protein Pcac1_g29537 [Phytophthora cactorum]|nr:hypothetical protein Pcac1_g29537 [Phytophthora cactorum]